MTSLYLARKLTGLCPRCGAPSSETSLLCETHRIDAASRVQRHQSRVRTERRVAGLCADGCGARCETFRCPSCAEAAKMRAS